MLSLYSATLLNYVFFCHFIIDFIMFPRQSIMLLANAYHLASFKFFILLTDASSTLLNNSGYNGSLCPVSSLFLQSFWKSLQCFSLHKILTRGLSNIYYYFKDVSHHFYFHEISIRNGYWIFAKAFLNIYGENNVFFFLDQIIWWIISIDFLILGYSCVFSLDPTWLWYIFS